MKIGNWVKKLTALYGEHTFYGPYLYCKGTRRRAELVIGKTNITKQYAKFKLEVKLGRVLEKHETVDHIDENPLNDKFNNLQLLSIKENVSKSHKSGKMAHVYAKTAIRMQGNSLGGKGENNAHALLTNKNVKNYRILFSKQEISVKEIMLLEQVSSKLVRNMLRGHTYKSIGGPLKKSKSGRSNVITRNTIEKIKALKNLSNIEIAKTFNIHRVTVSKIKKGLLDR